MKNYTITVNGNVYDVTVEENGNGAAAPAPRKMAAAAPKAAPAAALEVMKMETPVVAAEDGTVASIDVAVGDQVESGALLATLNN